MVEVMGAVLVIGLSVAASYYIVQQIITYTFASSSRLTAAYLAEEGIEIVRNIRDTNWVNGAVPWDTNLSAVGYYQIVPGSYLLNACPGACDYSSMGFVSYIIGANNKFKRRIRIERPAVNFIRVTSDVMWQEAGSVRTLTVQSYLYDWM